MKTKKLILNMTLAVAAFSMLTLTSCDKRIRKNGSGVITTSTRDLGEFSDVDIDGSYDLFIHESSEQKVTITTDDNIVSEVHTFVQDGKLNISMSEDYQLQIHENGNTRV
ncbi:MAG: DUF2807 domain-containing protein [Flavobacteriales bacterium]|nr:DUF2807 domain-containing protein [Flavobacteriales bacterium]